MKKEFKKRIFSSLFIVPIALFFILYGSVFYLFFLGILFLVTSYEWIKMLKKKQLIKILGLIFLSLSFYSAYQLRNFTELKVGLNSFENNQVFLFIILICIFTDIGGYIFGNIIKGKKLTTISPNKTYAGMFGSFISSLIICTLFIIYFGFSINFIFFTLLISLVSQVGDLFISYLKRKANIKDTGNFLPGHGGLLDRLDGIIFAIPLGIKIFIFF